MSQFECVCATNVPVGELRVHRCLSSAIDLMCLCHFHMWLSFASVPVICICVCPSVSLHPCPFSLLSGAT